MRRIAILTLTALALLALASGCRSHRGVATPPAATEQRQYTVLTFDGTVDGMGVSGQVRMAKDSVVWCTVSKLVELGRAMATVDSVWVSVPLTGYTESGDYGTVRRLTGVSIDFYALQDILESADAEARLGRLAREAGHTATLHIKRREHPASLSFPFKKRTH